MTTNEERLQILQMIESGTITAEEGLDLLGAIEEASGGESLESDGPSRRWFRVRVTHTRSGKSKVNINIPLGVVGMGLRLGAKFVPDMGGIDVEEIVQQIKEGARGKIIEAEDREEGERVEIYVE